MPALAGGAARSLAATGSVFRRYRAARRRLWAPLLAPLVVGLSAPALAGAEWSTPFDLSPAAHDTRASQVAVDRVGDTVFTWQRVDGANYRIQARARSATGALSAVQNLSHPGQNAFDPQVAVDPSGDAVFTWRRSDGTNYRVQARARSATGTLSAVKTLSASGQDALDPQVAVDRVGDAVFTWRRFDGTNYRVQARTRSAAGALSSVQNLSAAGQDADEPQVAVDRVGDAVFTWRRFDGTNYRVLARGRSAAGALSAVQRLSSSAAVADQPQVAVDGGGDAVFAWRHYDGTNFRVQARARSAAGNLSAVQNLSASGHNGDTPQVAVDPGGDAVFTWERFDGINYRVQARARSAAGTLSAVQDLSDSGQDAGQPQVAVDRGGDAVFAWQRSDGTDTRVEARSRSAAGILRPFTTLSDPGRSAIEPQVAVDRGGGALVAWERVPATQPHLQVQASAGP